MSVLVDMLRVCASMAAPVRAACPACLSRFLPAVRTVVVVAYRTTAPASVLILGGHVSFQQNTPD